jgi:VWFA-related protein
MRPAVPLFLLMVSLGTLGAAARQQAQFRAGTDTVSLYATVLDRDRRLATRLTKDDFIVLDQGLPQAVTVFANEVQPIALVLMLDRSASIKEKFDLARDAAARFVEYLLPEDRVRIGSFSEDVRMAPETFTTDRDTLQRVLQDDLLTEGSITLLWNATAAAMDALSSQEGRRVLLLFTDGQNTPDTGQTVTFDTVRRRAQVEDVMVYGVGLVNERCVSLRRSPGGIRFQRRGRPRSGPQMPIPLPRPPTIPRVLPPLGGTPPWGGTEPATEVDKSCSKTEPDPNLRALADVSGGGYFELEKPTNLAPTFARIADELHHQYALAYPVPTRDGKLHTIDVQVKKPGMTVRARRSYIAPGPERK